MNIGTFAIRQCTLLVGLLGMYPLLYRASGGKAVPHPVQPHGGAVLKGLAKSSLQFSQRHRQTGSKVLMLKGLRNLPKAG